MGPGPQTPNAGPYLLHRTRDAYAVQVRGLLDGGADLLIVETCQDLLQTKAALSAIFRALRRETRACR